MNDTTSLWYSVAIGLLLSSANIAVGLFVARRAQRLPVNKATMLVLSAMGLRLVTMVALIVIVLSLLPVDKLVFALTLMVSFFVMIMLETFFLHISHEKKRQPIVRRHHSRYKSDEYRR